MKRLIIFYTQLLVLYEDVMCKSNSRANELNMSKEDPSPIAFWPISSGLNDMAYNPNKRYAVLNGSSIHFPGVYTTEYGYVKTDQTSSVEILNNGDLNGDDAMTWMLYIRMTQQQTATLLQYSGSTTVPGFTFGVKGDKLFVSFLDTSYHSHYFQSDFAITIGAWALVGFTFNKLWIGNDHIDLLLQRNSDDSSTTTTYGMGSTEQSVDAVGNIRIGKMLNDSAPFDGDITCIQFYKTSLLGYTMKGTYDLCDPNLNSLPGDHTIGVIITEQYQTTETPLLADGTPCNDLCSFGGWQAWGSCNRTCGRGSRQRSRGVCCPETSDYHTCINIICSVLINITESKEDGFCNDICYNGGTFFGQCICANGWAGRCCGTTVKCGDPEIPNYSRLVVQDYHYSNLSAVVCDEGYAISSGDAIRSCNGSGKWNGTKPICSLADWKYNPNGGHGHYSHLLIDKRSLSKYRRTLLSVYEETPSKLTIGAGGAIIILLFFCFILCIDCMRLLKTYDQWQQRRNINKD